MLHDKVLPSFFLITVEDAAVRALIDRQFRIKKVIIASDEFSDDITATRAAQAVVRFFIGASPIETATATEEVTLNPEFFPMVAQPSLEERERSAEMLAAEFEELADKEAPPGKVLMPLTRNFDAAGDFVHTRSVVKGTNFTITTRVAVPPNVYLQTKADLDSMNRLTGAHREQQRFWLQ
jgi:hypothetical protein